MADEKRNPKAQDLLAAELVEQGVYTPVKTQLRPKKHKGAGRPGKYALRRVNSYNARKTQYLMAINRAGIRPGDIKRELGIEVDDKINDWFEHGRGLFDDEKKAIARLVGLEPDEIFFPEGAVHKG